MSDKMLKFVKIGQQTPPKREVDRRKKDFDEIYDEFISEKLSNEINGKNIVLNEIQSGDLKTKNDIFTNEKVINNLI